MHSLSLVPGQSTLKPQRDSYPTYSREWLTVKEAGRAKCCTYSGTRNPHASLMAMWSFAKQCGSFLLLKICASNVEIGGHINVYLCIKRNVFTLLLSSNYSWTFIQEKEIIWSYIDLHMNPHGYIVCNDQMGWSKCDSLFYFNFQLVTI